MAAPVQQTIQGPVTGTMYANGQSANFVNTRPVDVIGNDIACMMQGQEVPCASIPGLADALRAQGMHQIAARLPQVPAQPCSQTVSYVQAPTPCGSARYVSQTSLPVQRTYTTQTQSYVQPVQTVSQSVRYVSSPCGQLVAVPTTYAAPVPCNYAYRAPAPVSVRLTDGTVFALNGGVGAGIYGEFYGGGGSIVESGRSFSGVTSERFSYNKRKEWKYERQPKPHTRTPKPKTRYPDPKTRVNNGGCTSGCGSSNYHK